MNRFLVPQKRALDLAVTGPPQAQRSILSANENTFAVGGERHAPHVSPTAPQAVRFLPGRHHHDAEDAFQATFLVLVRKAASVRKVANWLHGVAQKSALQARRTAARRRAQERQVTDMPEPAVAEENLWRDLQPLLDQELGRLPGSYRAVMVLCDLEGKSRKETARQLGVPEGSVAGWLARARTMLARRLARQGYTPSGGALAAVLAQRAASAGVPRSVAVSTSKAVSLLAAGRATATGAVSVKVAALTEGVLKAMLVSKLKTASAVLLVLALVFGAPIGMICRTQAGEPEKAEKPAEQKPEAEDGKKAKTDVERLQGKWEIVSMGRGGLAVMKNWAGRYNVTFKGDTVRFLLYKDNMAYPGSTTVYARYRLDTSATPKIIQLIDGTPEALFNMEEVDRKFADADEQTHGIYAFDGDTLRLCFSTPKGKKGPTAIENTKKSNTLLYVLKRVPTKAK